MTPTAASRPAAPAIPAAARLRPADLAALAAVGLATRKLRASLSALGIAIGVAAIVAVLGLAASSSATIKNEITALGTNLLTAANGQTLTGTTAELPAAAPAMIARLPGVTAIAYTGTVSDINAYRSPLIPPVETNALTVAAASPGLRGVAKTPIARGQFLNAATARRPVTVLGATAAQLLGIDQIVPGERIWLCPADSCPAGGQWFYVTGILKPSIQHVASQIDTSVLVGFPAAERYLRFDGRPSEIYVRTTPGDPAVTTRVDSLLGYQAWPENPSQVTVSQPSAALAAQADAKGALDTLFLGLGAVALLVGAIGVANIMVISVLERRSEIGLRRALGATRGQIRVQFLAEATLLSLAGGIIGVLAGAAVTAAYAHGKHWPIIIPPRSLGQRPGRRRHHRRLRRAPSRHPRRPPLANPGTLEHLTAAGHLAALPRVRSQARARALARGGEPPDHDPGGWRPGRSPRPVRRSLPRTFRGRRSGSAW